MARSIGSSALSEEVNSLDSVRPAPVKARLPVNASQSPVRLLIAEAIRRTGSQKAAAGEMQIDPAQLTRQLQSGHLTIERVEALPPTVLAEIGRELVEQYGPLTTPAARLRQQIKVCERALDEIRQGLEEMAS